MNKLEKWRPIWMTVALAAIITIVWVNVRSLPKEPVEYRFDIFTEILDSNQVIVTSTECSDTIRLNLDKENKMITHLTLTRQWKLKNF